MKKVLVTYLFLAFSLFSSIILAQSAGSIITGQVADDLGPLMLVNVVEIDRNNRIVAHGVTDVNGNFSFRIKDPKNKLRISYVGYKTVELPIKGMTYKVKMEDGTKLKEVVVSGQKRQSSGLVIPEREVSMAAQTISAKEFEGLSITTIDEALQGRIAGLDIVANSGNLGAGTSMRLRGVSSINGNTEPLIVVDGNVWETDISNDFDFSSANEERFSQLLNVNPEDIESISVLKDAAATAIWGSQGANGVIEIKTRRGARGKTMVTYSYRFMGTYQPKGMELLDGDSYTMLMKEAYFNPRLSDDASNILEFNYPSKAEYSEAYMYNNNTDWVDAVKQFGAKNSHFLSVSGGGEKANFRISGGYDSERGSVIKQKLDRLSTRVALDYFVSDRIKFVTNFALTYTDNHKNSKGLLGIAYQKMPNLSIYEEEVDGVSNGKYYNMLPTVSSQLSDQLNLENPIALANLAKNRETSYNIVPEFQLIYNLLGLDYDQTQLKYDGRVVFNIFNKYNDFFYPADLVTSGWSSTNINRSESDSYNSLGTTTTHTLTFQPHFTNPDHSLMMMGRFQLTTGTSQGQFSAIYGLPSGTINSTASDGVISNLTTSSGQWRSIYLTYSAHYAYKSKYVADFSIRRDGSTKFGPGSRWGNFPALSLRWNISDEKFMESLPWISMLSIRPGWGRVGSQPGAEYLYFSKYSTDASYAGYPTIRPNNIRLTNLKWEDKETYNIGVDFGFLDDKLRGDVNIYTQKTNDLLMYNRAIPTSSGYSALDVQNVGSMRNRGWEFNINTNRLINFGRFGIDLNVTFANNKNTLLSMDPTVLSRMNNEFNYSNGSYLTTVELNKAFGSMYGFKYKGVYQYSKYSETEIKGVSGPNAPIVKTAKGDIVYLNSGKPKPMYFGYGKIDTPYEFRGGDAIYEDINNDGTIDEYDIVYLGSSLPKITGGFGLKFTYKRITWNNQFNFRYGNKIINSARMNAENMYSNNNQSAAVNWRWRAQGDIAEVPRALRSYGYNWLGSDRFIEDGSFIRLNYSQISYSVNPAILKKFYLNQLSLYVSGNNLFCLTKYSGADPEVGYGGYGIVYDNAQTPRAKSFTVGATIGF